MVAAVRQSHARLLVPNFVRVADRRELKEGEVRLVEADGTKVALCVWRGDCFALSNYCPHFSGNLSEGKLEGDEIVCPEHFWRFKIKTGRCTTMPGRNAGSFPVRIEDDDVLVGV